MRYRAQETRRTEEELEYQLTFPVDSGLFAGHFPDNPILPGVAQVQVCAEILARSLDRPVAVRRIESVRYRKPITPEMTCTLKATIPSAEGQVDFRWIGPEGLIAEGRLHLGEIDD